MANIHRLLSFSSLIALASCLPAANPDDDDSACWTSSSDYRDASEAYEQSYFEKLVTTSEHITTSTITNVPTTTLCDGKARLLEPYKTITVTSIETLESPTPTVFQLPYTEPEPTCTIADSACSGLLYSHHLGPKFCATTRSTSWSIIPCTSDASQSCKIADGGSTLFYWPVSTQSGDFCAQDGKTVFPEPTSPPKPDTAVVDGVTMTSPTAYMSFGYVNANRYKKVGFREQMGICGGTTLKNVVFPITESFYSADYVGRGAQSWSFNYADLNTVPAEAYSRQVKCSRPRSNSPDECTGALAVQAEYTPMVVVPTDLANLKPEEWKAAGCVFDPVEYEMTMFALATPTPTAVPRMLMD